MYTTPQIDSVGSASELIQGSAGHIGEPGVSGQTKLAMLTALEAE